jgi:origin recognition complex subunit 3
MSLPAYNLHFSPSQSRLLLQPFFVLHKAAAGASLTTSRARRRVDKIPQPSSPNPKSAKRPRDEDEDDEGDMELYERLRLEAFHRTWSKIQSTINVCLSSLGH